ncbi:MAG: (d)CMP kinase [Actinomycetota bacterium]|nr:(d)CMP kinase [Actinomycetota bacterium]
MVIAIDGPGGVGKSTVARAVAGRLGLAYLDTGATYRAATLVVLEAGVSPDDADAAVAVVDQAEFGYSMGTMYVEGRDVAREVRSAEVTANSSTVSAHPAIRERIVAFQRLWVAVHGNHAVVEGRDIGTAVFPEADAKIFLTARPGIRAARRAGDPEAGGKDLETIAAELDARDEADSTRATSPLQPATDAVIIDTSDLAIDEVVVSVLAVVTERTGRQTTDAD